MDDNYMEVTEGMLTLENNQILSRIMTSGTYALKRPNLVNRASKLDNENHGISKITIHTAIRYLDVLMTTGYTGAHGIAMFICIQLASKMTHDNIGPDLRDLVIMMGNIYEKWQFKQAETQILRALHWRLHVVTPFHFVVHFYQFIVDFTSDLVDDAKISDEKCVKELTIRARAAADYFCDLCLYHYEFSDHSPSRIAAACIHSARKAILVYPSWTDTLVTRTSYREQDIVQLANGICILHNQYV